MTSTRSIAPIVLTLVGVVAIAADAQPRHAHRPPPPKVIVVPVPIAPWAYAAPVLPYAYYYEQELAKRWPPRPSPVQSFEGSSPRCSRFFCEEVR